MEAEIQEEVPGPMLGKFVRIHGLSRMKVPTLCFSTATGDEEDEEWDPEFVDGEQGQCIGWAGGPERVYTVLTFGGLLAKVSEGNLEEFEPKAPEAGGFDAVWPANEADTDIFTLTVADTLRTKGYCVVQTFLDQQERKGALASAYSVKELEEYRQEFEYDYMGKKNSTKVKKLKQDTPESEPENALERCNHQLTNLGLLLVPLAQDYMGFNPSSHSKAVARVKFSSKAEEDRLSPVPLADEDIEEGIVKNHILFLRTRRVCMLYMIDNDGGEFCLYPKDGGEVMLPISANKLVLFCHNRMSYSYKPQGESLAVQAWMLGDIPAFQFNALEGSVEAKQEALGIVSARPAQGRQPQVMSMMTRYPGDSAEPMAYWSMQAWGTDCITLWPTVRFDLDLYYSDDPNDVIYGKAYTCHGGFLQLEEVNGFDNEFFGIDQKEAHCMSMNQRMFCEVGYEALLRAGWDKKSLYGQHIGTWVGDVGSDWHDNTKNFSMWCYDGDYTATAVSSAVCPARLSYIYGMIGPTMTFDTACSASLYALHSGHMAMQNMTKWGLDFEGGLIGGVNSIGSTGHVGNCQGNILTHTGRCWTFDEAADGYQRGEGTGAIYIKLTADPKYKDNSIATVVGSVASHDGKSASLTAPSGPAQQVMIRHSLRFTGLEAEEVSFTECHGTGTSLGDPIEMGAIAACLLEEREDPLFHTTPKSNIAHLESAAGLSGAIKMILAAIHCFVPPNVHFRKLNPHVDMEGFPRVFQTELCDLKRNAAYSGCSSFGFGGANARADIYATAKRGPNGRTELIPEKLDFQKIVSCPKCGGNMCAYTGVAVPVAAPKGPQYCTLVREEFADYDCCSDCYDGSFRYGTAIEDLDTWKEDHRVWIVGSWDGSKDVAEMEPDGEGSFTCLVQLGDTGIEDFHLLTNFGQALYPATKKAGMKSRILVGGTGDVKGRKWRINGITDGASSGAVYEIKFTWGEKRTIQWKCAEGESHEDILGADAHHRYFIAGSWMQWGTVEMVYDAKKGVYETSFTLGRLGRAEFHFLRDRDQAQVIHAALAKAESTSVPIRGPDDAGIDRNFVVRGRKHGTMHVELSVVSGRITMKAIDENDTALVWYSGSKEGERTYHVSGTFNRFTFSPMEPDNAQPGVFKCRVQLVGFDPQDFQIVADEDIKQTLHPDVPDAPSGDAIAEGPDAHGDGLYWQILGGSPGAYVDIVLDVTKEDRRKMVTWEFAEPLRLYG